MNLLKLLFSRRFIVATLLVLAAMAVMARLGVWQLDRLKQRRASNAVTAAQLYAPRLDLNQALASTALLTPAALSGMQYRQVQVRGVYDFSQQVGLRNKVWSDQLGNDLLTPLRISGSDQVILVDRGWVSQADFDVGNLAKYNEPGEVTIQGVILDSQSRPSLGNMPDPAYNPNQRTNAFFAANTTRIAQELPYPLLPVYIQQNPDPAFAGPPYRQTFSLTLSDGPHLSYAIQWFSFALILGIGYPILVKKNSSRYTSKLGDRETGTQGEKEQATGDKRSGGIV